jgi:hypothetical protein
MNLKLTRTFLSASLAIALAGCQKPADAPAQPTGPMTLAVPVKGAYTGAYIDFGDYEDQVTLEGIEDFENLVGKHQAIVASSSYWGEQSFPTANLQLIFRHGSVPLVFWSPWDRPYNEDQGPDKFSLTSIIEGKWDSYIDMWADAAKAFGHPMMVSFANEVNGTWFPWSGCFYGGGNVVEGTKPPQYQGPETFKKAYRHVVDRVRARGAYNVSWVFHAMNYSIPQEQWNLVAQYYPGPDYVDWLGLSVYGEQYQEDKWCDFLPLLEWPYQELCQLDPNKPIMLTEWGVGEFPQNGDKAKFFRDGFSSMSTKFPRLKAAVYWNERWQNEEGTYSNLRVNSTPEALAAFRTGVQNPFWLGEPQFTPVHAPAGQISVR